MDSRRLTGAVAAIVLAPGLVGLTLATGAPGDGAVVAQATGNTTCRASALRITGEGLLAPLVIEPFVANETNNPCLPDDAGVINPAVAIPAGLGTVRVLYASTDNASGGSAEAGVAQIVLRLPQLPVIRADVLTSEADVTCVSGQPQFTSSSHVVRLQVGEDVIELPPEGAHEDIEVPGVPIVLHLNESTTGPTADGLGMQRVQQALFLDTPVADVVIAESIADYRGNPCGVPPTTPPPTTPPPTTAPPTTAPPTAPPTTAPPTTPPPTTAPPLPHQPNGFMTGGGRFGTPETQTTGSSSHGMVIPCTIGANPGPNLTVNWSFGSFHLNELTSVYCTDQPGYDSENPDAPFDTVEGTGTGTCRNKQTGVRGPAEIAFRFTDQGEPGRNRDTSDVEIEGTCVWSSAGTLTPGGNHQAHSSNRGSNPEPSPTRKGNRKG